MILCLGTTPTVQRSMVFDRVEIDGVNRAVEVQEYASGKSPNVARVLRTLGADPLEIGFAGGDRGRLLLDDLIRAGIRCDFVNIPAQTRLCTTVIDRSNGTATELVEEHAAVSPLAWARRWTASSRIAPPPAKTWIFSGSLPAGRAARFLRPLGASAGRAPAGATLILDAGGDRHAEALAQRVHRRFNREELAGTLGISLDSEAALSCRSPPHRCRRAEGQRSSRSGSQSAAIASDGRRAWRITPPSIKSISPVGSGDAFAAGLALGLLRGQDLPTAMILASACGAANAMTRRLLPGHLRPADVDRLCVAGKWRG